jgi:hypothetical protein
MAYVSGEEREAMAFALRLEAGSTEAIMRRSSKR